LNILRTMQTERLILRPFREDDLEEFYAYASDPEVGPKAGWKPHDSRNESWEVLQRFIREREVWALVEKETGRLIGSIGLHQDTKRSCENIKMLGYVIGRPWWGKGYATEAAKAVLQYGFRHMRLRMVTIYHYPFNERSRRVIEKCGFSREGILRMGSQLWNGVIYDDVCYSMTREEYFLREGAKF
jgi:ribosomal-protein-alanine N-acetyltransferase